MRRVGAQTCSLSLWKRLPGGAGREIFNEIDLHQVYCFAGSRGNRARSVDRLSANAGDSDRSDHSSARVVTGPGSDGGQYARTSGSAEYDRGIAYDHQNLRLAVGGQHEPFAE
jgi:hypothetical protein